MKRDITQYDLAELKRLFLADLEREGKRLAPGEELKCYLNFGGDDEAMLVDDTALILSAVVERIPLVLTELPATPVGTSPARTLIDTVALVTSTASAAAPESEKAGDDGNTAISSSSKPKRRSRWDNMTPEEKEVASTKLHEAKKRKKALKEAALRAEEAAVFPVAEAESEAVTTVLAPALEVAGGEEVVKEQEVVAATGETFRSYEYEGNHANANANANRSQGQSRAA